MFINYNSNLSRDWSQKLTIFVNKLNFGKRRAQSLLQVHFGTRYFRLIPIRFSRQKKGAEEGGKDGGKSERLRLPRLRPKPIIAGGRRCAVPSSVLSECVVWISAFLPRDTIGKVRGIVLPLLPSLPPYRMGTRNGRDVTSAAICLEGPPRVRHEANEGGRIRHRQ